MGSSPYGSSANDGADASPLGAARPVESHKVVDWALDLQDGRRIVVPGLNPGALLPLLRESLGDSLGKE